MTEAYKNYLETLDGALSPGTSFDLTRRKLYLRGGREATLYYITGFVKDIVALNVIRFIIDAPSVEDVRENIPYTGVAVSRETGDLLKAVMSGETVMAVDGMDDALIIDTRNYPVRGITEPENDRVLRGPRDGFTETLLTNVAMIRRRIRDPALTMYKMSVGELTKTDIVLGYFEGRADPAFVANMKKKIENLNIGALNLGQESLSELLIKKRWYNPFPKIRYTERPDAAAAMLLEGSVLVLCDNSPSVMMLPVSIFDFLQATDDFYFPPLVGTYLRLLRLGVFFVSLLLTPVWYLLLLNPQWVPQWLPYVEVKEQYAVPIIAQLFIVEFAVDGLKLASLNTPNSLNSSLSIIGGLILGDFAVQVGWLIPEVILYMALVAITNFTQSSYELGYAFKFMRIFILCGTALASVWGFAATVIILFILIATNKTIDGSRSYLYPLVPWNGRAMARLLFRVKLKHDNWS